MRISEGLLLQQSFRVLLGAKLAVLLPLLALPIVGEVLVPEHSGANGGTVPVSTSVYYYDYYDGKRSEGKVKA